MIETILDLLGSIFGFLRTRQDAANAPDIKANKVAVIEQGEKDRVNAEIAAAHKTHSAHDLDELEKEAAE